MQTKYMQEHIYGRQNAYDGAVCNGREFTSF